MHHVQALHRKHSSQNQLAYELQPVYHPCRHNINSSWLPTGDLPDASSLSRFSNVPSGEQLRQKPPEKETHNYHFTLPSSHTANTQEESSDGSHVLESSSLTLQESAAVSWNNTFQDDDCPVCWVSPGEGDNQGGGVVLCGAGCLGCRVGEKCSFWLRVNEPTVWFDQTGGVGDRLAEERASVGNVTVKKVIADDEDGGDSSSNATTVTDGVLHGWFGASLQRGDEVWWKDEVMVTLQGPSLLAADVECVNPPNCTLFGIAYTAWDAGEYR